MPALNRRGKWIGPNLDCCNEAVMARNRSPIVPWIPWQKGLAKKKEVLALARIVGRSRRDVAATLMEFWEWCDAELVDGLIRGLSLSELPSLIEDTDGRFWQAVVEVGWLTVGRTGVSIPNFERWLGRSAKRRLQEAKRLRELRSDECTHEMRTKNVLPVSVMSLSSELMPKKKKAVGTLRAECARPEVDDVRAYCVERGNRVDPQQFCDYYQANGWRVGRNPMRDWRAAVRTWEKNGFVAHGGNGGQTETDAARLERIRRETK